MVFVGTWENVVTPDGPPRARVVLLGGDGFLSLRIRSQSCCRRFLCRTRYSLVRVGWARACGVCGRRGCYGLSQLDRVPVARSLAPLAVSPSPIQCWCVRVVNRRTTFSGTTLIATPLVVTQHDSCACNRVAVEMYVLVLASSRICTRCCRVSPSPPCARVCSCQSPTACAHPCSARCLVIVY